MNENHETQEEYFGKSSISHGKTYEMQYLTDEETAVINAMRMGAKVAATFYNSTYDAAAIHAMSIEKTIPVRNWVDLTHAELPFITLEMRSEFFNPKIIITHIIHTKKAAE